ncbi:VOC family protein [Tropicimonas sp. IMCC34043]|uniref:VOC family protein n=1 Tax=Tropicimonas sp. IMCC34043 TaxID=2248760 RepID=UPI000E23AC28|nr:VOC family protein [Tropicimonas sp. IMCC34043]
MPAPAKVCTCLWCNGDGEAAAQFYVALLPDSRIEATSQVLPGAPPLVIEFTLAGSPFMILNMVPSEGASPVRHGIAASISVRTEDQAETDRLWAALLDGGGEERRCGWLTDRFGILWQIVPDVLPKMLNDTDRAAAGRAREAMMKMRKIDIAALEAAFG